MSEQVTEKRVPARGTPFGDWWNSREGGKSLPVLDPNFRFFEAAEAAWSAGRASLLASCPDDIRAAGYTVAVHNDYRQDGRPHTFWLFTDDYRAVKGEGPTDAEALNIVRAKLGLPTPGGNR